MSAKRIGRRSRPEARDDGTDWKRLRAQSDVDIDRAIIEDPDAAPAISAAWLRDAQVVLPQPKTPVYIRLDTDVIRYFKEAGPRYQTRINAVLRAYVRAHPQRALGPTPRDRRTRATKSRPTRATSPGR